MTIQNAGARAVTPTMAQRPEGGEADTDNAGRNLGGTNDIVNIKNSHMVQGNPRPKENLWLSVGYVGVRADSQAHNEANDTKNRRSWWCQQIPDEARIVVDIDRRPGRWTYIKPTVKRSTHATFRPMFMFNFQTDFNGTSRISTSVIVLKRPLVLRRREMSINLTRMDLSHIRDLGVHSKSLIPEVVM